MPTARKGAVPAKSTPVAAKPITAPRLNRVRRFQAFAAPTIATGKPVVAPLAGIRASNDAKLNKTKLRSRRFTIPADEHALLAAVKKRLVEIGVEVRKSELLRAGVKLLSALDDAPLKKIVATLGAVGSKAGGNGKARKRRF